MRSHRVRLLVLSLVILAAACGDDAAPERPTPDAGPDADIGGDDAGDEPDADIDEPTVDLTEAYYDFDRVLDVDIEIDEGAWDTLRAETRTIIDIIGGDCLDGPRDNIFSWQSATVTVDGEKLDDVGIRKKGYLGSLSMEKPSLKLRFDKNVDGQSLGGALKRMTLNNVQQDASKMNTCLTYHVFRKAGLAAPRCNFARVSINGEHYGLYVHVESIKKAFLARNYDDDSGNLYEGTLSDFRTGWDATFEKKTNTAEGYADIAAVTRALEDGTPEGMEQLSQLIDVDQFLTFWAAEVLTAHWDGYAGNRNNFLIYAPPGEPFSFIPWGPDSTFAIRNRGEQQAPVAVMANGGIAHRFYNDPTMRAAYVERLKLLLDTAWDEDELHAMVDKMEDILLEHALDFLLPYAAADSRRVREFIDTRREMVTRVLDRGPEPWPAPLQPPDICWDEIGAVDITFETSWNSLGARDPFTVGQTTIQTHEVDGKTRSYVRSAAAVGINPGNPEEREPPSAVVVLRGLQEDQTIDLIYAFVAPEDVVQGVPIALDVFRRDGFLLDVFPPNYEEPQPYGRVSGGTLTFEEVEQADGARVVGRLQGKVYEIKR